MTDIRTAAQREAGARVIPVVMMTQGSGGIEVVGKRYDVASAMPTLGQLERAIMGRTASAAAKEVLALLAELAEGNTGDHERKRAVDC